MQPGAQIDGAQSAAVDHGERSAASLASLGVKDYAAIGERVLNEAPPSHREDIVANTRRKLT